MASFDFDGVWSGAGALGVKEAGATEELARNGARFLRAAGASAGAINSAGVAFGFIAQLSKMWSTMLEAGKLEDFKLPGPLKFAGVLSPGWGMIKGDAIREALSQFLGAKVTVGDSPIPLRIVVSNLEKRKSEVVDSAVEDHKNIKVIDALMCSLAVPFVINAQRLFPGSALYSDGGDSRNVPSSIWDDDPTTTTLAMRFRDSETPKPINNVRDFAMAVFNITRDAADDELSLKAAVAGMYEVLWLDPDGDAMNFAQSASQCDAMARSGVLSAKSWLAGRAS